MLAATKQRYDLFVKCFAAGMFNNATQAAIDAGYMPKRACDTGIRLCKNLYVAKQIANRKAKLAKKHDITAERTVAEFARLGYVNMADFVDDKCKLKTISEIGRDNMAAVQSITFKGKGKSQRVEFKLHSKTAALDALGKHLGIFGIDNLQKGTSLADIAAIFAAAQKPQIGPGRAINAIEGDATPILSGGDSCGKSIEAQ